MTEMDIISALAVLEDAIRHCMTGNINLAGVLEALGFLHATTAITRPFEQRDRELDFEREGRQQVVNASRKGNKRAITE